MRALEGSLLRLADLRSLMPVRADQLIELREVGVLERITKVVGAPAATY